MGLLQGPRLMAWTTKSPIRRNHWVPLGCRGHLGSVKPFKDMNLFLNVCYVHGKRWKNLYFLFHYCGFYLKFVQILNAWNIFYSKRYSNIRNQWKWNSEIWVRIEMHSNCYQQCQSQGHLWLNKYDWRLNKTFTTGSEDWHNTKKR